MPQRLKDRLLLLREAGANKRAEFIVFLAIGRHDIAVLGHPTGLIH